MSGSSIFGHNAPPPPRPLDAEQIRAWLDFEFASLRERVGELARALAEQIAAVPQIDTEEQMLAFADNLRMAKAASRTAEDRRKEAKAPFLDGGREIDGWFRELMEPLGAPMAAIQRVLDAYQARVAAEKRKAAEEAARRAREEAARAAAAAAATVFSDAPSEDAEDAVAKAQRAAARAGRAEDTAAGSPADLVRTHSDLGTVATAKETLEFEVVDEASIPREYLVVDHSRIRAALRAMFATPEAKAELRRRLEAQPPQQPIPGVRITIKTVALVR